MGPLRRHRYLAAMNLLLLHGALGSARQLEPLQERMGGIAIDLAGHGGRDIPAGGLTFDHFIADIDRAFAEQKWENAHLFGYSMGGYAALLFAARYPHRVRRVATLGTKYLWTSEGLHRELRMLDPDAMLTKVPAFAQKLIAIHGEQGWRPLVASVANAMSALAAVPLLSDEVKDRIVCPLLLCVGEGDNTAVPEDTRMFARGLRNAEVLVLPGAKHPFESVDIDVLVAQLRSFFQV